MNFFKLRKNDFFRKNTDFLNTGTRDRFESSKFRSAVKSLKQLIKITLIVLKEDFGSFFLVRYLIIEHLSKTGIKIIHRIIFGKALVRRISEFKAWFFGRDSDLSFLFCLSVSS